MTADQDIPDMAMLDDVEFWAQQLEQHGILSARPEQVMADARNYRELECLAKALDTLETMGSLMELSAEYVEVPKPTDGGTNESRAPGGDRKFWSGVGDAVKVMKDRMPPLLSHNWLLTGIEGTSSWFNLSIVAQFANQETAGDEELGELRQAYLPETMLAFVSGLHYAGTGLSRDNLLECMDLAGLVAQRNSELAKVFVKAGRMTELVEAFAAASKALAIATGEKRATGSGSKKMREMGWSRDLWAVKQ